MTRIGKVVLCAVLVGPTAAMAESTVVVDGYFLSKSTLDLSFNGPGGEIEAQDDGDGYGGRAMVTFGGNFAVTGEFQTTTYDDDFQLDQSRVGVGLILPSTSGIFVEFNQQEDDGISLDGFAVRARVAGNSPTLQLYADIGWAMLTEQDADVDFDGLEFTVGGAYAVTEMFGIFLDYRTSALEASEGGSNLEYRLDQIRMGGRVNFGF